MTNDDLLVMLKANLEIITDYLDEEAKAATDAELTVYIDAAKTYITREGATLSLDDVGDCQLIVMYAGSICEKGTADDIFYNPCHEYTKGLLRSIPTAGNEGQKLQPITGTPIDLLNMPKGCPFAPRCDAAMKICIREKCESFEVSENHSAACWMNLKKVMDRN